MRLYLDDDCASPHLARYLRSDGNDVQLPGEVGLAGRKDPVHLLHAITEERVLLTKNYGDFEDLHNLVVVSRGEEKGTGVISGALLKGASPIVDRDPVGQPSRGENGLRAVCLSVQRGSLG